MEADALRAALEQWSAIFGETDLTAAGAVQRANSRAHDGTAAYPDLLSALAELAGVEPHKLSGRALGYGLRKVKGRRMGGRWFDATGESRSGLRWRLVKA